MTSKMHVANGAIAMALWRTQALISYFKSWPGFKRCVILFCESQDCAISFCCPLDIDVELHALRGTESTLRGTAGTLRGTASTLCGTAGTLSNRFLVLVMCIQCD